MKRVTYDKGFLLYKIPKGEDFKDINWLDSSIVKIWNFFACRTLGHKEVGSFEDGLHCGHCMNCDKLIDYCNVHKG